MLKMDWSLLGCSWNGHVTYAPDEPELRERLTAVTAGGPAWRCLRCGTFVGGVQPGHGPAAAAPLVRRGSELRSQLILRVFAVERFLRFLVFAGAAYGVWRFKYDRAGIQRAFNNDLPAIRDLYRDLGFSVTHSKLLGLIHDSFTLDSRTLTFLAIGLAAYALIELVEAVGLWLGRRWGEYFAMVATSVFLPYEIYDLTVKITWLRIVALVVNLLLVVYLVWTKRLFGARGGKKAYDARLRSESVIEVEQAALADASSVLPALPRRPKHGKPASAAAPAADDPPGPALPAGAAVDQLADDVGMPGVPGCLLQQVRQHPAQADRRVGFRPAAQLVQAGPAEGRRVHPLPRLPVGAGDGVQRVIRLRLVTGDDEVVPREAVQHPGGLGAGHVLDQPQQAGAGADGRPARRGVVEAGDFPDQRFPLISQESV